MMLKVGDIAIIQDCAGEHQEWDGLRCEVVETSLDFAVPFVYVRPLSERPDGYGTEPFLWTRKDLVKVGSRWDW